MKTLPFKQVDAFTARPFMGNPVAVILGGEDLDTATMQRITRWTNLSEATFVLPSKAADYRLRIFSPTMELPFAGHPTLGSAHAWLEAGGTPRGARIVQECAAGLLSIERGERLAFEAPPLIREGPVDEDDLGTITEALRISRNDVVDDGDRVAGQGTRAEDVDLAELVHAANLTTG